MSNRNDIAPTVTASDLETLEVNGLARVIKQTWPKPYFGAVPYIEAMNEMTTFADPYYCDKGADMGLYFLANANTYRGEQAKLVKAEIKRRLKLLGYKV